MKIIVHRGTHQIGGCATEIKTDTSRIIIDAGSELDGNTPLSIPGVTEGKSSCDAVLFTHYHGDHIGLIETINKDIPLYMGELSLEVLKIQNERQKLFSQETIDRIQTFSVGAPMLFGDIQVSAFAVDHSAIDSYVFLVNSLEDGKTLLHTGDFRSHGFRGKGLIPTLEMYVGGVDALICEGTTLNRHQGHSMTEYELYQKAKKILTENKYVFVACASTNFDRIAAFCSAVPYGKYCLCDGYQKSLLQVVADTYGKHSSLYQFPKMLTYSDTLLKKMEDRGFCMFVRLGNHLSNQIMERFKDKKPLVVYSMWSGYLDDERIKKAIDGYRTVKLHTSGHADIPTISQVVETVNPSVIIPIHTEAPENFPTSRCKILSVKDGEEILL